MSATVHELQIPPHSAQAEQSILGCLMLDNSTWDKIADQVGETDFYRKEHRLLFRALSQLVEDNQPFDVVTLAEHLERTGELDEAGGLPYLGTIAQDTPSAANILAYARIVRERAEGRRLLKALAVATDQVHQGDSSAVPALLDALERTSTSPEDYPLIWIGDVRPHIEKPALEGVIRYRGAPAVVSRYLRGA